MCGLTDFDALAAALTRVAFTGGAILTSAVLYRFLAHHNTRYRSGVRSWSCLPVKRRA